MQLPGFLQQTSANIGTSAVANTSTSGTLVAAPGAGLSYRLWAFTAATTDTTQAPAKWRAGILDSTGAVVYGVVAQPGFGGYQVTWPGGIVVPVNTLVQWWAQSSVASISIRFILHWTQEQVQ